MVNINEYDIYTDTIDEIENRIEDNNKFPVVEDSKIKILCKLILEFIKIILNYLKYNISNATKKET